MKISRRAVGDRTLTPSQITYRPPGGLAQDRHIEGLPLGTRGGMLVSHTFPLDAEYELSVGGGAAAAVPRRRRPWTSRSTARRSRSTTPRSFRIKVTAGPHIIGAALVDRQRVRPAWTTVYSDFRINSVFTPAGGVQTIAITGPFNATGPGDTPSRRRIFVCHPGAGANDEAAVRAQDPRDAGAPRLSPRRVLDDEVETLMGFYQQGRGEGDFEAGIQQALARILVAPRFLFRFEAEPEGVRGRRRRIASAISSSPRACRSSCGAAFRTTSCWIWRPRGSCTSRRCSSSR